MSYSCSPERSFSKEALERSTSYLLSGIVQGKSVWYRLRPKATRLPLLKQALGKDLSIDLTAYAEIIDSGWGTAPQ